MRNALTRLAAAPRACLIADACGLAAVCALVLSTLFLPALT